MKLREFIRETLVEIAFGVHQAKVKARDLIAISPGHMHGERITEKSYVDFDVAVTVNDHSTTDKTGKAIIKAEIEVLGSRIGGELGAEGNKSTVIEKETVSRVVFKVPVYLNAHFRGDPESDEEQRFIDELSSKYEEEA